MLPNKQGVATDSIVMKNKPTVETYYAVRIGNPSRHKAYFMVRDEQIDCKFTPWLFMSRKDAEKHCPKQPSTKVVKVTVSHGKSTP